jgi:hypothetical protein
MKTATNLRGAIWIAVLAAGGLAAAAAGQDFETTVPYDSPPVAATEPQAPARLSDEQLDGMLAPIALYPDSLLAQVLPAATYPLEVVSAWQWVKANPNADPAVIDQQPWESPVRAVAHYPAVLQTLAEHADWMQALGAAFLTQQEDVMASIQRLRQAAIEAGNLRSTAEQQVIEVDNSIEIMPATPDVVYVPEYDPEIVYVRRPEPCPIFFRLKFAIGRWLDNDCDWHHRWVAVGGGWHQGWRFEDHTWRPLEARNFVVDRRGITRVAAGVRVAPLVTRPWSHNRAKPIPVLPPPVRLRGPVGHVEVGPARVEGRAKPFSVPRPVAPVIETHAAMRPPVGAFGGDGRSTADVNRAVQRAEQSRSSWAGKAAVARPAPAPAAPPVRAVRTPQPAPAPAPVPTPVRAAPLPRPTPAPAPLPAPVRVAPAPVRAAPVAPPARAVQARPEPVGSPFTGGTSARETDSQSKRGHQSLRR